NSPGSRLWLAHFDLPVGEPSSHAATVTKLVRYESPLKPGEKLIEPSPLPTIAVRKYVVGQRVRSRWQGGAWYNGVVTSVHANGSYGVNYDDGSVSREQPERWMESLGPPPSASPTVVLPPNAGRNG